MLCNAVKGKVRLVARQASPAAIKWTQTSREAKLLHVFDRVCYLANEDGTVIACATPELGLGPFSLIASWSDQSMHRGTSFQTLLTAESSCRVCPGHLHLGRLIIDTTPIRPWRPRPAWDQLTPSLLYDRLLELENYPEVGHVNEAPTWTFQSWEWAWQNAVENGWQALTHGLITCQLEDLAAGARQLAGLGPGLTPAGDDVLVGTLYAIWAIRPHAEAWLWSNILTSTALPHTTSVSAAWLKAAGRGEATQSWHELVMSVISGDTQRLAEATHQIMSTGSTSGRMALRAFVRAARILLNDQKSASQDWDGR